MDYPTLPIGFHWAPLRGSWYSCEIFKLLDLNHQELDYIAITEEGPQTPAGITLTSHHLRLDGRTALRFASAEVPVSMTAYASTPEPAQCFGSFWTGQKPLAPDSEAVWTTGNERSAKKQVVQLRDAQLTQFRWLISWPWMILIRFDSKLGNAFLFATPWLLITVAVLTSAFFILLPTVHRPKRGLSPPSFPLFLPSHAEPDKFILADAVVSILIGTLFLDQIPKHLKCAADPPAGCSTRWTFWKHCQLEMDMWMSKDSKV